MGYVHVMSVISAPEVDKRIVDGDVEWAQSVWLSQLRLMALS